MKTEPTGGVGMDDGAEPEREPPATIWLPIGLVGFIGLFNLLWAVIVYGFMKQKWGDALMFAFQESLFAMILAVAIGSGQKVSYGLAMGYLAFYAYRDWERASKCYAAGHIFTQDVEYIYSGVNAAMLMALLVTLLLPPVVRWFFPKKATH